MYPGIELRTMRYIVAVGRELHFTRGSEAVRVSQPALSKQIRDVEKELGVQLFKRTSRKVELTDAGRTFIDNAQQALMYAERAGAMARAASAGQQGKLFLGVSPTIDLELFFRLRNAFQERYPDVECQFVSNFARQQADGVMRSDLHASLIELPIRYRGLAIMNVFRESLILALPRNDKLASTKRIIPAQLNPRQLILLSPSADLARDRILAGLRTWGYRPEKIIDVVTLPQVFDFVAAGDGFAVLRESAQRFQSKKIVFRSVLGLPTLDTGIAYRRDIRTPLVRNLIRVAREVFAEERGKMIGAGQQL